MGLSICVCIDTPCNEHMIFEIYRYAMCPQKGDLAFEESRIRETIEGLSAVVDWHDNMLRAY